MGEVIILDKYVELLPRFDTYLPLEPSLNGEGLPSLSTITSDESVDQALRIHHLTRARYVGSGAGFKEILSPN